jgi:hypothetical protein
MSSFTSEQEASMQSTVERMERENQMGTIGFFAFCVLAFWQFKPLFGYAEWTIMGLFALGTAAIVLQLRKLRIDVLRASLNSPQQRRADDYADTRPLSAIRSAR